MAAILIPFVLFDVVILSVVVWYILQRRKQRAERSKSGTETVVNLEDLRALATFAKDQHERIGEHMRAHWNGSPATLPGVLTALLQQLEREAMARKLIVGRSSIKTMLGGSLRAHKIGSPDTLRDALDKVA